MNKIIFILLLAASFSSCNNSTKTQTAEAKYQCPMNCEEGKTYDKPGQCPVCNMDLIEVQQNHEQHEQHEHDSTHTDH